jgi:hypothetical protein
LLDSAFRGSNHDLDLLARCTGRGAAGEREGEGVQRAPIQPKILEVGAGCADLAALMRARRKAQEDNENARYYF